MTARNSYLLRKYGITEKQYEGLLVIQTGRCAVCKRSAEDFKTRLAVDHDHHTGEIRGLLCIVCNHRVIGRHRRDAGGDVLLRNASQYLTGPYTGWFVPPKKKKRKARRE